MKPVDARIEPLLTRLKDDPRLPTGAEEKVRRAISESPFLSGLIANAADNRQVGRIAVSYGENNGGHFEEGKNGAPGTIFINATIIETWKGEQGIAALTEILGHETMNGVLTKTRAQALADFTNSYRSAMDEAYQSRATGVDLTDPVRAYLDKGRQEEALAEVAGLRSLNSRIASASPDALAQEVETALIYASSSRCVQQVGRDRSFAPGLSYEALTGRGADSELVTTAVEQCFYDGKGTLGKHGDSDYRNYYGTAPLASIAHDHAYLARGRQPPEIRIDLRELGLDPAQLERNGLNLGAAKVLPIVDFGKDGLGRIELNNTGSAAQSNDNLANRAFSGDNVAPGQLSQTDQRMLDQIRGKVGELDKANGRSFDDASERMSASLLVAAKGAGLTQVDHVLLSIQTPALPPAHNLFVVQGDPANPASTRAHVPTLEAAQRPVQDSLDQVAAIGQRQAQDQALEQQQTQERQQRAASPSL